MGIEVVTAASVAALVPLLRDRLAAPVDDPFVADVVVVPSVGVREWLVGQLAGSLCGDGGEPVLANARFVLPGEFNVRAVGLAAGDLDRWRSDHLRWLVLGELTRDPTLVPGFAGSSRPLAVAQRVAELFDRYGVHRPEMLEAWRDGDDGDPTHPLPAGYRWQPGLWRRLRHQLGESPAERFLDARRRTGAVAAMGRVSVFGLELFSSAKLDLLARLAEAGGQSGDIAVYNVFAAPGAVASIASVPMAADRLRASTDLTAVVRHPLVRSWGGPGAEAVALLAGSTDTVAVVGPGPADTVLHRLQAAVAADEPAAPGAGGPGALDRGDGTVQLHLCHGPTRQVGVLRDALLHLMADDPTLACRDIVVVCPDLATFAPLLEPVLSADVGGVSLPIAVIDRSVTTDTAVAVALDAVLATAAGRITAGEVAGLLELEPVRRRLGVGDDEAVLIGEWLDRLGTSWGLSASHRAAAPWGYPSDYDDGTWRQAIDRLCAGVLIGSPEAVEAPEGIMPFDDVGGSAIETVGRLATLVDRLDALAGRCRQRHTIADWARIIDDVTAAFIAVDDAERDQLDAVATVSAHLAAHDHDAGGALVDVAEIRSLVSASLDGVRSRSRQWGDVVRVGSLTRLRGVPARVVAILGFDDNAFRPGSNDGDDVLAIHPRIGERDFHAEQRLGLLTTLCAATDAVVITANGHDVTNNKRIALPVALEELKDAVAAVAVDDPDGGRPVVVWHPRQAADPANLGAGDGDDDRNVAVAVDGPWSFDPTMVEVAATVAASAQPGAEPTVRHWPVLPDPGVDDEALTLGQLVDAVRRPTDTYVRHGLRVVLPAEAGVTADVVPVWSTPMREHALGAACIEAGQRGQGRDHWRRMMTVAGGLPPGLLGQRLLDTVGAWVDVLEQATGAPAVQARPVAVDVGGVVVRGDVLVGDGRLMTVSYSWWHRRHRVAAWLQLALATLAGLDDEPADGWEAMVVTRPPKPSSAAGRLPSGRAAVERFVLAGSTAADRRHSARQVVEFAIGVRRQAVRSVVPLFERASWELSTTTSGLKDAITRDLSRPATAMVFGDTVTDGFWDIAYDGVDGPGTARQWAVALEQTFLGTVSVLATPDRRTPVGGGDR